MADYRSERLPPVSASVQELFNLGKSSRDPGRRPDIAPVSASFSDLKNLLTQFRDFGKARQPLRPVNTANSVGISKEISDMNSGGSFVVEAPSSGPAPIPASRPMESVPSEIRMNLRDRSFMDTPGAFTGPNNDPTTPGMTREWVKEPALTTFSPDDARYEQRQAQIVANEAASQANLRDAIAAREQSDSGLKREVFEETRRNNKEDRQIAAEDRLRRRNREDSEMAWRADFEAAKAAWSEAHGGQPWSPEAQAKQEARDYEQSVAVDHEASIRYLNALETDVNNDLDAVEQGGVPSSPDTIKVIQEITGKPFGQVALDRATLERIRTLLGGNLQREREMATEKMQSLLKILKVNKSEKESEF